MKEKFVSWNKVIFALDVDSLNDAAKLTKKFENKIKFYKIGLQLFTQCGKAAVEKVHMTGARVFLDLKFHDIPNTVAKASENATELGVFMFNVHAQGGLEMMRAAKEASLKKAKTLGIKPPKVLGVTLLTSLNESALKNELKVNKKMDDYVVMLAKLAKRAGLDGVVASAHEAKKIRKPCGKNFLIVTPGIRLDKGSAQDQKRVATPGEAFDAGADYIVMGRALLKEG